MIKQYETINYEDIIDICSRIRGINLIPVDELESPIGLRVEGGGYIFYDDTVGFSGGNVVSEGTVKPAVKPSDKNGTDIAANALATRWGVEASYGDYYYDMLRGCVVRESAGTCNRFMVVDETDMVSSACGSMLMWDTSTAASTSRATSTDFGQGSANTILLAGGYDSSGNWISGAITDKSTIWPTVMYSRYKNPQGSSSASNSAINTSWFVPSRDELCVLLFMSYYDSSYRPFYGKYKRQLQIPFWPYYWSSSQVSDNAYTAWYGDFYDGYMGYDGKSDTSFIRVRLCRTF